MEKKGLFDIKHCAFFRDNGNGRCVADCHYNKPVYDVDEDCMGNTGKSLHGPRHFEVRVSMQFTPWQGSGLQKAEALADYHKRMNNNYGI